MNPIYLKFNSVLWIGFFLLLLLFLECGHRIAVYRIKTDPLGAKIGINEVEGAIFAILGLLLAFTFSGAAQRFEYRRQMLVDETNAISTAWLRVDVLPQEFQQPMRTLFQQYTDARITVNQKLPDVEIVKPQMALRSILQNKIWQNAILASEKSPNLAIPLVFLPALNTMFDIATSHNAAMITHPHPIIFITLFLIMLISSCYVGYSLSGAKHMNRLNGMLYNAIMLGVFYVIIDFEFPRIGFINIKVHDKPLIELREQMK